MASVQAYLPTILLRNITIYPNTTMFFDVGQPLSMRALEEGLTGGKPVFLIGQKEYNLEGPMAKEHYYNIGTIVHVRQLVSLPGDTMRVMVDGYKRGQLENITQKSTYLESLVTYVHEEVMEVTPYIEKLLRDICGEFSSLDVFAEQDFDIIEKSNDPGFVADTIAQAMVLRESDKQDILQEIDPVKRLQLVYDLLLREQKVQSIDHEIQDRTQSRIAENQREYYLREQIKVIQEELGEDDHLELQEYYTRIENMELPEEVEIKLNKELKRLSRQSYTSSESAVIRNYVEVCLDVPWCIKKKKRLSVNSAKKQLEKDHFGLEKVKERILEHLAVRKLAPDLKGQVLCLVGPPGVGKTSIAKSIAEALGRDFARVSLGGIRDESEIRGHRKTYIGAMPGRIIAALRKAGSNNPVILLDELDKMGNDHRGDPSAALLEVLDVEQNNTFRDHFLELPFDLSNIFFITTANSTSTISRPLLDRMEVIEVPSYTDEEKIQIGKKYLLPKELEKHGMTKTQLKVSDGALREVITGYTHESGVRNLQRQLGTLCRKIAMKIVAEEESSVTLSERNLKDFLGAKRYHGQKYSLKQRVGVVNGLAWTSVGGELLEVEVNIVPGTGKVILTGNLGDVMKESAQTALSLIRSRSEKLNISSDFHETKDVHIHFPEGGIPKDGPSAGIAITTAIVSAATNKPIRPSIAMTGEVSLRGRVLAIGGLREKSMAALRNGVKTVLIPMENEKDLEEIDQVVRNKLEFISVETIDQVLDTVIFYKEARKKKEIVSESEDSMEIK